MSENIFVNLRNVLAALYPDELSIRRILTDSSIDLARVLVNSTPINNWHSILTEANKTNQVDSLLGVVESEYGNNKEFQKVCDIYRRTTSQTNLASERLKDTVSYSPTKIVRECLEQAFDSESIRVFCQDYFPSVSKRLRPFDGLDHVVIEIIKYSEQHGKFDYLWQSIKVERASLYEHYFPHWQKITHK